MGAKNHIIVALDVSTAAEAKALVQELASHVGMFKIGLELITAIGAPAAVALVKLAGGKVMFDAKFNDIPNTMAGAAKAVAELDVDTFTVHASAGPKSIAAAVASAGKSRVIGVTVLTSLSRDLCIEIFGDNPVDKVNVFAQQLADAGAYGIVCSPQEVASLVNSSLTRIIPGVRPLWAAAGDQARVMTPEDAIVAGADYLVIGRPITKPPPSIGSRVVAAQRIAEEMERGFSRVSARLE